MTAIIRFCSIFCPVSSVYPRVPTALSNFIVDDRVLNPRHKLKYHLRLHVISSALVYFYSETGSQNSRPKITYLLRRMV